MPTTWRKRWAQTGARIYGGGEEFRGRACFLSYCNRSVHNSRIERLWYDVTEGFGRKWKEFFYTLEDYHGLDALDPSHIWLLHQLFLPAINEDALAWSEVWNSHKIQLDGERRSSPRQLFTRSRLTDGVHGLPPQDEHPEGYGSYGIDWEAIDDRQDGAGDAMGYNHPDWVNNVVCEPPRSPLTDEQVERMMGDIAAVVDVDSKSMDGRRVVWIKALELFLQCARDEPNDSR